jgi:two-component system, chemotaxis family, protein-glutamate methylesterase/glutaminase
MSTSPRVHERAALRALVADTPTAERRTLCAALSNLTGLLLSSAVSTTELARRKVRADEVDVLFIDPNLDGGSGFDLVREASQRRPRIACFLLAGGAGRGVAATDAILAGALGVVPKPSSSLTPEEAREAIVPALAQLLGMSLSVRSESAPRPIKVVKPVSTLTPARRDLIAIGASTGGPPAVTAVLRALPRDMKTPVLLVQHMGGEHLPHFVALLASQCERSVLLATQGAKVEQGTVYVAPGGSHTIVERRVTGLHLVLIDAPPEHNCRPAVDPMFRSVAAACGPAALAVILTGMGSDGALGAKALREAGAPVIAQDEASCVVWGMPGATVSLGAASVVVPLDGIAKEIQSWMVE